MEPQNGTLLHELPKSDGAVTSLAFSHHKDKEKTYLAVGTRDAQNAGQITIWQIDGDAKQMFKATKRHTLATHKKGITALAFCPAIARTSRDAHLRQRRSFGESLGCRNRQGEAILCTATPTKSVASASRPDGKSFASGGRDRRACVYELDRDKFEKLDDLHLASIETLAIAPLPIMTGRQREMRPYLLTGSADQTIRISDISQPGVTPRDYHVSRSHVQPVSALLVNQKQANLVASASFDGTIKLYEMDQERFTLVGHQGPVRAIAMAADQSFLVSAGNDGTIRIWRAYPEKSEPR